MKDALIWVLIIGGPALALIGMRRHRVGWSTSSGLIALIAAVVTVAAGVFLLKF